MAADLVFLDTNILVYANVASAPLHQAAITAIQNLWDSGNELWISHQVLREFLVTVTRPQTFAAPQPISIVLARVRYFQTQFKIAEDSSEVMNKLLALLVQIPTSGKQVYDANIVATMQAYGISYLLTHNTSDFNRFTSLITVSPLVQL
ncbi:MAG: ribonuclease VapC [Chloroflexota bacterium]|nr:MAG: ribonuclease VapC [Chloroflexota bacterium]